MTNFDPAIWAETQAERVRAHAKHREIGARVKMWLDVNFLDTRPIHLGGKIKLPD